MLRTSFRPCSDRGRHGRIAPCAFILLLALAAAPASAQTIYTWTGAVSGDWGTPANWTPNGVPGATRNGTDTAQFGASSRTTVTVNGGGAPFEFGTLKFAADASAYTFDLAGATSDFYVDAGITNLSTAVQPSFTVSSSDCLCVPNGDLANSRVTSAGYVVVNSAGSAVIDNLSGGVVQIEGTDSHAATIMNEVGGYAEVRNAQSMLGSLSGGGDFNMDASELTIGYLDTDDVISGVIRSGTGGSLTKTGAGTLTLTGANIYTALTIIESGEIEVDGSLLDSGSVDLMGGGLSLNPATLGGSGSVGGVSIQEGTHLIAGDANPNTSLTMDTLGCSGNQELTYLRIGNDSGGGTQGTYLHLHNAVHVGTCPALRFWLESAGEPLHAGEGYLIALMDTPTDYTTSNLTYVMGVAGYSQAHGHFLVSTIASTSVIFFVVDDIGDEILRDGFEP